MRKQISQRYVGVMAIAACALLVLVGLLVRFIN